MTLLQISMNAMSTAGNVFIKNFIHERRTAYSAEDRFRSSAFARSAQKRTLGGFA